MINKYRINQTEFLVIGEIPYQDLEIELLEENISLKENSFLPIFKCDDFILRIQGHKRTTDKLLMEEGIQSFNDLSHAYHLLRINKLEKSVRIRRLVEQKYTEIINKYLK